LITGCSPNGLGAAAATSIAAHDPNLIVLAGRSRSKVQLTETALKAQFPAVNTRVLELDLACFASVRKAAGEVNHYSEVLDVLINNAAVMATPFTKTVDGIESNFGTNHLGPFLFTNLLLERMLGSGRTPRIVNVSSSAYGLGAIRYQDVNFEVLLFLNHF
jgi:NAD(P)-dependent dehydrogenase (short-subunit alcohol dehydrogenase family)